MPPSHSSSPVPDTLMPPVVAEPAASAADAPPITEHFLPELSPQLPLLPVMVVPPPPPVIKESIPLVTFTSPGQELSVEGHESLCTSFLSCLQSPVQKKTFELCKPDSDIDSCMASYIHVLRPVLNPFTTVNWLPWGILFLSPLHVQKLLLECSKAQCYKLTSGMDIICWTNNIPKNGALPVTWDTLDFFSSDCVIVPPEAPVGVLTSPSTTRAVKAEPALLPEVPEAQPEVFVILDGPRPKAKSRLHVRSPTPLPPLPSPSASSPDHDLSSESEAALVLAMLKAHSLPSCTAKSTAINEGESEPDAPSGIEMVEAEPVIAAVAAASSAKDPSMNLPFLIQNPVYLPMYFLAWRAPMHAVQPCHFWKLESLPIVADIEQWVALPNVYKAHGWPVLNTPVSEQHESYSCMAEFNDLFKTMNIEFCTLKTRRGASVMDDKLYDWLMHHSPILFSARDLVTGQPNPEIARTISEMIVRCMPLDKLLPQSYLVVTPSAPTPGPSIISAAAAAPLPLPTDAESLATFIKAFREQDHEECWAHKEAHKARKEWKLH
ncbi:uncharacterized protein LAESUDRAFT_712932 [Laetiporus sulphureus 93-53]|uniref:Uncharacterized protein n=1 Tax=Laetiporus sulphureus 93-53 TaxID=1314785 RepID=A0A165F5F7_9APHY|nr:uncharacterized protein LAESUDRAFT_712932 [Laetiporus sulphureus 93-53]KZT08426.1 hypothetical protein LAESUDRAFT_712932 [Laetiporus sulphureus 93-53]